jgi:arylsulfatase A-like enzyme
MSADKPNILFILTDQMRSTAMGCAGVENVRTPNLDRLAEEGTRFTNAVSNTPACTPARASLLTGKHVLSHGLVQNDMQLGHNHRAIAHVLTDAGYRCGYIGKWHVDGVNRGAYIPPGPRRQGFDDFWAGTECNHNYFAGYYYEEKTREPVWFDGYEPDGQSDLAVDFLQNRGRDGDPFCLFVSWSPPHCPYEKVPQMYRDMYPPDEVELLPNAVDAVLESPESKGTGKVIPADLPSDQRQDRKREIIGAYYAHVTAMDECLGRLLEVLDRKGLREDTIVVFTSDHGDMLFSQNRGWKAKPWRESVGIPLLMRWPGRIPAGRETRGPIGLVDLAPTLLQLAGCAVPPEMEGGHLAGYVRGNEDAAPGSAYINFPCMNGLWTVPAWRGVVTRTHTYAASPEGPWVLYDDRADPFQMENLVESPDAQHLVAELDALTREWLDRTGDDFPPAPEIARRYIENPNQWNYVGTPPLKEEIRREQEKRNERRASQ